MDNNYNTEIISVGTELLLGHVTNTDARDVSEVLSEIGINVLYHTVVGDNPARLEQCIEIARKRADIIITTGGLGPTCDDLTKQILCRAFGLELERNEDEYRELVDYISARHVYTENNTVQAMLPAGCTVFHNSCGTAPGCAFKKDGTTVIMLPGPPHECLTMMRESAVPYLRKFSSEVIVSHTVRIFGISESAVDDIFAEEMNRMSNPSLAPYAKEADCLLKVTAKASTKEEAEEMCRPVIAHIKEKLGDYVYGLDIESVGEAAAQLLADNRKSLAIAEGFTGGLLSAKFTDVCPEQTFLKTGVVLPLAECNAEYTEQMAANILKSSSADLALAVSGEKEGEFFTALATEEKLFVKACRAGFPRPLSYRRIFASNCAFDMLRRYFTGKKVF